MNSRNAKNYRATHDVFSERCAALGVRTWFFDASGSALASPADMADLLAPAGEVATATFFTRQAAPVAHGDIQLLPLPYALGSQIAAVSIAAVPSKPMPQDQLISILKWTHTDLCAARRHGSMLDEFSEQLSQAFEELNLVFRMSHLLNSTHSPQQIVRAMCDELRKSLCFGWVAIHFCASHDTVPELTSQILASGAAPCGNDEAVAMCSEISASWSNNAATKILRPETDALAAKCASEVLIQPVLHDGRPVALIFAGNKQSPDSDVCSIEIQMLQAAARFMGMAHQNMTRFSEQRQMFLGTVQSLTAAVDAKDPYTRGHSERVGMLARQMAEALALGPDLAHQYYVAGLLHDVGKIGIPEAVLGKSGKLTDDEFTIIKKHPEIGYRILTGIPSLEQILPGVLHHHERWDGRGYPHQLAGDNIPFIARVLCICDTFDAMNSKRSYRDNIPRPQSIAELKKCAGSQFDATLVPVFLNLDLTQYDQAVCAGETELAKAA